jgi:hypothetical protein
MENMEKRSTVNARATLLEPEKFRMQEQPRVCGQLHAACDRNPKCTCTTVVDANNYHPGSHTSPFHIWF